MAVSAGEVKALRDATGAGMMDCKKALQEAEGDLEKAKDILRQQGLAKGEKRAGRSTAEGAVAIALSADRRQGAVVELNCETDFVGRTDDFRAMAAAFAEQALAKGADSAEDLDTTDAINDAVSRMGEVIRVGQVVRWTTDGLIANYLHTATHRIAVLVELGCEGGTPEGLAEIGKELAMQVAAMQPVCVNRTEVPADKLEHEKALLREASDMASKPPQIQEKMIEGRLGKFYSEICLLEQPYTKDDKQSVQKYVEAAAKAIGAKVSVRRFVRLEVGRQA